MNVLVEDKLGSAKRVDLTLADAPSGGGANYLIIGSDTRDFIKNAGDQQAFGDSADAGGQRSDTIMVLHTDPDSGRALLVSFPRDLWVDVPGRGKSKINAAFNDGPQAVIDTLANNFNVPIHHYVEVNFDSFRQIVDAIGTVPVYFPTSARDALSNLHDPLARVRGARRPDRARVRALPPPRAPQPEHQEVGGRRPRSPTSGASAASRRSCARSARGRWARRSPTRSTANDIADARREQPHRRPGLRRGPTCSCSPTVSPARATATSGPESQTVPAEPATRDGQSVLEPTTRQRGPHGAPARLRHRRPEPERRLTGRDEGQGAQRVRGRPARRRPLSRALEKIGFQGGGVADADQPLQTSEIHYARGSEDEAALVATFVAGPVHVVADDSVSGADVVLHIGSAFEGIVSGIPAPGAVARVARARPRRLLTPAPLRRRRPRRRVR